MDVKIFTHEDFPDRVEKDQQIRLVYDEWYETRGTFAFETEEETKAAEDHEIEQLSNGHWIVLGRIVEERCCACASWNEVDSLWGIVVDNSDQGLFEAAFEV